MKPTSEQGLIERCRQGDDAAFRALVDQYKGLVFGLIARSIPNRARADEVAQDIFLKVHRGLPYFRGESKLSTWIYRIVINAIAQERPELATTSLDELVDDDRPKVQPGAHDRAFGDLVMKDRLQKAVERLPVQYQVLINGHYLKGMRYEELADALDIPLGTVKTHLHRAKRQLRQLLETEYR